jgi:signal peptidase I
MALPWLGAGFSLWTAIVFMLMLSRIEQFGFLRTLVVYVVNNLVLALVVALFVRTFLYQPFNIPASSMMPTLRVGDYVFVSKSAYGYSRFSLPFSAANRSAETSSCSASPKISAPTTSSGCSGCRASASR